MCLIGSLLLLTKQPLRTLSNILTLLCLTDSVLRSDERQRVSGHRSAGSYVYAVSRRCHGQGEGGRPGLGLCSARSGRHLGLDGQWHLRQKGHRGRNLQPSRRGGVGVCVCVEGAFLCVCVCGGGGVDVGGVIIIILGGRMCVGEGGACVRVCVGGGMCVCGGGGGMVEGVGVGGVSACVRVCLV